jgi:adenosylcobinamide-phosphate synthase
VGLSATTAVGLAAALDGLFEEPPARVHPVALFGRLVGSVDREWGHPDAVGVAVAFALPLVAATVAGGTTLLAVVAAPAGAAAFAAGVLVAGGWLFATTSLRLLLSAALEVVALSETDVAAAREAAPRLVGRDTDDLSPGELRSAAVESAAENLADGLVAPLLAFAVGMQVLPAVGLGGVLPAVGATGHLPLVAGVAAAAWVKAVDTLDSMLGYRSKPVGAASARLDDVVVLVPARASALLLAVAGGAPGALGRARPWARSPASPNSGWPMATLAAVLDVRLAKPGAYELNPGTDLPTVEAARRGVRTVGVAGGLAVVLAGVMAWV